MFIFFLRILYLIMRYPVVTIIYFHNSAGNCKSVGVCKYGFEFFNFIYLSSTFTKGFEVTDTNIDSDSGHDFM